MKRVLLFIITTLVICGCTDDEFHIGDFALYGFESIHPGDTCSLSYSIVLEDASSMSQENASNLDIQWKSSNPEVAKVIDGVVYGIDVGIAVITATIPGGFSDYVRIYVVRDDGKTMHWGPVMLNLTDITETTAQFKANLNIVETLDSPDDEFIFACHEGQVFLEDILEDENTIKFIIDKDTNINLTNLWPGTRYTYGIVLRSGNKVYSRNVEEFVTDFPENSIFDLSAKGTANCYIVPQKGTFRFKAYKGNSGLPASVETVKVLWETFGSDETPASGDLIKEIFFSNFGYYILFKTNDTFKDGNALIAAYDSDGEITWSWHIWFTEQEPLEVLYKNDSGTMMDRNLGALASTPEFKSNGLFYQWGRKDPFIGSAKSTGTWPTPIISDYSRGTIEYSIAHPTTFIRSYRDGEWDYHLTSDRWTTSEKRKSKYDPCPEGWRVPDGGESGIWAKASGHESGFYSENGNEFGNVFGFGGSIYYPYAGHYDPDTGEHYIRPHCYWSATPRTDQSDNESYVLQYATTTFYGNNTYPTASVNRATGAPIRCMKE